MEINTVAFWVQVMMLPMAGVLVPLAFSLLLAGGISWVRHAANG